MTADFFWCLIPAALLVLLAVASRLREGSWLAPGPFMAGLWSVYVVAPLVLAPDYDVSAPGLWCILASVFAFDFGTIFSRRRTRAPSGGARPSVVWNLTVVRAAIVFGSLVGTFGVLALLANENRLGALLSLQDLQDTASYFTDARYNHAYQEPKAYSVSLSGAYAAAILAGAFGDELFRARRWSVRIAMLTPLVPTVLVALTTTMKAPLVLTVVLAAAGHLSMRALQVGSRFRVRARTLVLALSLFGATVLASRIAIAYRTGTLDEIATRDTDDRILAAGALGPLSAFCVWFDRTDATTLLAEPRYGAYTVGGVLEFLGVRARERGVYLDDVSIGRYRVSVNLYTIFRGLILDFTLPGSLLVLLIGGLVVARAYRAVQEGRVPALPILATFYATAIFSWIVSLLVYNSILMALLIYGVVMRASARPALAESAPTPRPSGTIGVA